MDIFADQNVLKLCQSLECNGTVSLYVSDKRVRIVPRRTPDGSQLWSECCCEYSGVLNIHDFPILLYTKLLTADEELFEEHGDLRYRVRVDLEKARCVLVSSDGTAEVECKGCRVDGGVPLFTPPTDISTPHLTLRLPDRPNLQKLLQRLQRFKKNCDTVLVSADRRGHLILSLQGTCIRQLTITIDAAHSRHPQPPAPDDDRLVGTVCKTSALLRALRVPAEQVQFSIAHREYVLVMSVVGYGRVTAILPHTDP